MACPLIFPIRSQQPGQELLQAFFGRHFIQIPAGSFSGTLSLALFYFIGLLGNFTWRQEAGSMEGERKREMENKIKNPHR